VEAVLHGHPAVADCAVFGVPDGTDGEAVVAAVVVVPPGADGHADAEITADDLVALVGQRLASYKRPRDVAFVAEIPRLPSGKVLRRVLKESYGRTSDQ
nr:class I adenylate-forming enzyme family protein [Micromonospora sp. DSM 115978]